MKYSLELSTDMSTSFRAMRAANSLDLNLKEKSLHSFEVEADLESPYSIGLIVGASGSGKSTLAKHIFGSDIMKTYLDKSKAVIDQFPEEMNYDDCANVLTGIGLSSVPCWLKPAGTLSNGQQARAEAALSIIHGGNLVIIDEWTSVVDRTVAKVMSHCVQKFARRSGKKVVLVSCHYDVIEWLDPDWIIDCNSQSFIDRRLLQPDERRRKDQLNFEVREVTSSSWKRFSKYHYLSSNNIGGRVFHFGLFLSSDSENYAKKRGEQIGYGCLVNYVPWRDKSKPMLMHVSRVVIHPDYAGFGLGIKFFNAIADIGKKDYRIMTKFSSAPVFKSMSRDKKWKLLRMDRQIGKMAEGSINRGTQSRPGKSTGFRENVKTWTFEYIG